MFLISFIIIPLKSSIHLLAHQALPSTDSVTIYQTVTNLSTPEMLPNLLQELKLSSVCHGVLQGLVFEPFSIYLLPLCLLFQLLGFSFCFFADDTHIYISCSHSSFIDTVGIIKNAYQIITQWISSNFLKINREPKYF